VALGTVQKSVMRNVYIAKSWLFPPWIEQSMLRTELDRLRADIAARMPGNPAASGYKVYSQTDEDGILDAIFRALGEGERTFAELGCGNGLENNTHTLLLRGWRGVWVDGSSKNIEFIGRHLPLSTPRLSVEQQFITRENAYPVVRDALAKLEGAPADVDLLSIDLDGNDAIILDQLLLQLSPRVVCVEYNGKFHYPVDVEMPYNATHGWSGDDYYGASLAAFMRHVGDRYRLVACSISGVNAFFVRSDLAGSFPSYPPEDVYQPSRHHLIQITNGPPSSLRSLAHALQAGG
jgi:hypothetical protein